MIHEEELEWLKDKLEKVLAAAKKAPSKTCLPVNRQFWSAATLRDGLLETIANQKVTTNEDGILYISDERSPYRGLLVWRWKSQVTAIMGREYRYLCNQERKEAEKENRPLKKIAYPKAPIYNPETDEITYPGYSRDWTKK